MVSILLLGPAFTQIVSEIAPSIRKQRTGHTKRSLKDGRSPRSTNALQGYSISLVAVNTAVYEFLQISDSEADSSDSAG